MWRPRRRRGRVRRRRGGRGSQRGAPRAAAASRSCSQSSPSCAHTKGWFEGEGSSEVREAGEGRTDAPGVRRKKARRSPSLMSRRTLQPSHASRRIVGGGGGSIGVGEERELELGKKRSDKRGFMERAGRVGSARIPPNQTPHQSCWRAGTGHLYGQACLGPVIS